MSLRLTLAAETRLFAIPDAGRIGVFGPPADADLSALPRDKVTVVQGFRPDADAWAARGYDTMPEAAGRFSLSVVFLPRAKDAARGRIAEAAALTDGPVVVDGQKTDGVDSILREIRKIADAGAPLAKAHGKIFAVTGDLSAWSEPAPGEVRGGFVTRAGAFSADGPDPGSERLVAALPERLGRSVADLGAGWGYIARAILAQGDVETMHLVEADHRALGCARQNVTDPRAVFHWADATRWEPPGPLDAVVMNPPFHQGRAADPGLGRSFIAAARAMLTPSGSLWLVANRHLPYEKDLSAAFRTVTEVGADPSFKVLHATRPLKDR